MGVYLGRNAVEVYGGGVKVKPEEGKTVTASTSTIEVTPTSGMALSKVTVNPTPSEEKTVTPSASQQIVSPSDGKLLSQVTVDGDTDLTPENIKIFGIDGVFDNSAGLYVWKKYKIPHIITFTIGTTSYQAEEGMTWEEWIASEYNTDGWYYQGGIITNGNYTIIEPYDSPSDIIESGVVYSIKAEK